MRGFFALDHVPERGEQLSGADGYVDIDAGRFILDDEPVVDHQSKHHAPRTTTQASTTTNPSSGGAGVGGGSNHNKSNSNGGSTNVRVPATFAIQSGGKLVPATVSAPAFLAIEVMVASTDGSGYQVVVHTPTPYTLAVPAGGKASLLIPGQRAGQYKIDVDGRTRGALLIGGEPGP